MIKEIGSEFWKKDKKYINDNERLFLSGRTALDAIIKDAKKEHIIKSALLPSYCCHTMIEPFMRNNIKVRFYDIFMNEDNEICADIPMPQESEIIYIMNYFGMTEIKQIGIVKNIDQWDISIEDITHSCFHDKYTSNADYEYVSYRKWFAIEGLSLAKKKRGQFLAEIEWKTNLEYCKARNSAFLKKYEYICEKNINKIEFLEQFLYAEELLDKNYEGCLPDLNSVIGFFEQIRRFEKEKYIRRQNAEMLAQELKDIENIRPFIPEISEDSCPLFYPIIVPENIRDLLRKYLIDQEIYCPVHWPISEYHSEITERAKGLYNSELSLVCDQRYGINEMIREAREIKAFFKEYENICRWEINDSRNTN